VIKHLKNGERLQALSFDSKEFYKIYNTVQIGRWIEEEGELSARDREK